MAEVDYTPEQKKKIAKHFVSNAPHGEAREIIKDLRSVAPDIVTDAWTQEAMAEYTTRKYVFLSTSDGNKVVACPQAEVNPNTFLNPNTKKIYTIDPVEEKIVNEEDASGMVVSGQAEDYRSAMQQELNQYLGAFYEDGSNPSSRARGVGLVFASTEGQLALVVSYKNLNIPNYWTGGWQSEWSLLASQGQQQLEGRIRLNVHYFEDGNVQLNSVFTRVVNVNVSDPNGTAQEVIQQIRDLENEFQNNLDQFYVEMDQTSFKNMRRALPKIGVKMDWRASVHQLNASLAS